MIGFSASSPSVVGLRLPFSLFVVGCSRVCPRQLKMVYSDYVKQRILFYRRLGKSFVQITRCLAEEGHATTKIGVCKFIRRYEETGMISRTPGSGKASKLTADAKKIIEEQMEKDDETTGVELQKLLAENDIQVASSTALRWRTELGWTSKGTSYCQMICEANEGKRLEWAEKNKDMSFEDVIYTDETTVQLETHRRTCCYKRGQKPRYKPKPKHPLKVHVWAGISHRGRTTLCIFEGKMNAPLFISILKKSLVPFIRDVYPDGHRFVQDNDPKHCSKRAQKFYAEQGINWWPTPPESPDLNPIENLWHELKEYIRRVKPRSKQELMDSIRAFWRTVTVTKCQKYIGHVKRVIPAVIQCKGRATGY